MEPDGVDAWELSIPRTVQFGWGRFGDVSSWVAALGSRVWLVRGGDSLDQTGTFTRLNDLCLAAGIPVETIKRVTAEPSVSAVAESLRQLYQRSTDGVVVVAIGGGSTIDFGKALACLITTLTPERLNNLKEIDWEDTVIGYLEGVGKGYTIDREPLPLIAIPTTAGTGAEATRNAVISCSLRRFKKSLRSPLMIPRVALIDPQLCVGCPVEVTKCSGLDAITQLIEAFVCRVRRPLVRALVLDVLPAAVRSLPRVIADGSDKKAWEAMSQAALVSGIALAHSGLGMAHGIAAALGVECGTPHGKACAVLLPTALATNRKVCQVDFALLERAINPNGGGNDCVCADRFVERMTQLVGECGVTARLSHLGLRADRIEWLAANSFGSSMNGNPVVLVQDELERILQDIY